MPNYTEFFGVSEVGNSQILEQLNTNVTAFLSWAFLNTGAFFNVSHPSSGVYNNPFSTLRKCEDPNYLTGQVYETFRSNWVWESGLNYSSQPINISGVYVNNTFQPIGTTGVLAYTLDYPKGRVVFNSPISSSAKVEIDYSYRYVNVYPTDNTSFRQLMFNSFRSDSPMYSQSGSGNWATSSQNRVQQPAIFVESVPRRVIIPKQLGGGQFVRQDLLFHIFCETPGERNNLVDILLLQKEHKIYLFDKNQVATSGAFPLKIDGSLNDNPLTYPDLVNNYTWRSAYFYEVTTQEITDYVPGLYRGIVRATLEIDY